MIIIKNMYQLRPGEREAFIEEIRKNKIQEGFLSQPGCVAFDMNIPLNDDVNLGLTDIWEDREAFEAHLLCDVNNRWAPIKERFLLGSAWVLFEGVENPEYGERVTKIMADKAASLKEGKSYA